MKCEDCHVTLKTGVSSSGTRHLLHTPDECVDNLKAQLTRAKASAKALVDYVQNEALFPLSYSGQLRQLVCDLATSISPNPTCDERNNKARA